MNAKNVLDYTEEELKNLSKEQIQSLIQECTQKISELDTGQLTDKLLMNSLYGAMANKYFPLFNEEIAKAITGNGRYFIRGLSRYLESKFQNIEPSSYNYLIYNDTDSCYFTIKPLVQKFLERNPNATKEEIVDFCVSVEEKIINPCIQEFIDLFAEELNAFDKVMIGAGREVISSSAILAAKKKYLMQVEDLEGKRFPMDKPYLKVMGLDVIKGGTPNFSKKYLMEAIPKILNDSEASVKNWLRDVKSEFLNYSLPEISQSQGVSRIDYVLGESGIPQGSRCAIVHNKYVKDNNLENLYPLINGGDKIKKVFLRTPNVFRDDVIGFTSDNFEKEIPKDVIDYDLMFEKGFLNMLELMVKPLNWNIKQETEMLDDW